MFDEENSALKIFVIALIVVLILIVSFLLNAALVWVILWAFGKTAWWSWKICIGVWLIEFLLGSPLRAKVNVDKSGW